VLLHWLFFPTAPPPLAPNDLLNLEFVTDGNLETLTPPMITATYDIAQPAPLPRSDTVKLPTVPPVELHRPPHALSLTWTGPWPGQVGPKVHRSCTSQRLSVGSGLKKWAEWSNFLQLLWIEMGHIYWVLDLKEGNCCSYHSIPTEHPNTYY
jgi:hypothetical protein